MTLEESRAGIERVTSGIPGLDVIAFGGLPRGRAALVSGSAGAGKTTFALQFLVAGTLDHGEPGVFVSFEERPADLVRNVEAFGWALDELIAMGRLAIVDASPTTIARDLVVGPFELDALWAQIAAAVADVGARRIVLDSIGALLDRYPTRELVRGALSQIVARLRDLGLTALLTSEREDHAAASHREAVEEFVVDAAIVLRNPLDGERRRRTVEVLKLRGGKHRNGEFPFTIDATTGVSIVPISAIELEKPSSEDRVSVGNVGIDALFAGGGVFSDSLLLVAGATGTGKTCLACEMMRPTITGEERGLLLAFEESRRQVLRNAAGWGIDLEAAEEAGTLDVLSMYAGRMSLGDLLLALERAIRSRRPSRVAIDSLTALERVSTPRAFREFVIGLITLLKEHEVLGLFSHTNSGISGDDFVTDAYVSTMTDGIILLRYVELDGDIRRALAVLKMRGTPHDHTIREYTITDGGIQVGGALGTLDSPYLHNAATRRRQP
jgi:circadian clock protein KaiC